MKHDLRILSEFVSKRVGVDPNSISPNTTLFADLGVDGDDAVEFFEEFKKEYGVNLEAYCHNRHFRNEGMWPWEMFRILCGSLRTMHGEDPHVVAGIEPITVARLSEAIENGYWR